MVDPLTWLSAMSAKYGPTLAGLMIGTAAKYGLTLTEGGKLTWKGALADILLLGMLGLLAIAIGDALGLTGNYKVLAGALAAVSSDRLVRLARDRFMKRAGVELDAALRAAPEAVAQLPGGTTPVTTAKLIVHRSADPRAAGVERIADAPLPANTEEFNALLDSIDAATPDQVP